MKKIFFTRIALCVAIIFVENFWTPLSAQVVPNKFNLEKYWRYRERLRQDFIVVTGANTSGTNIPALELTLSGGAKSLLSWGDANANMSHYIGMLATEYRLLKNSNGNYQETLTELYYALSAIDRLDRESEAKFRGGVPQTADLNGWFIRDDVDQPFWNTYNSQLGFNNANATSFQSHSNSVMVDDPKHYQESISQDNVYHLLEALGLVNALVTGSEVVRRPGQPNQSVNFAQWAKNITERCVLMMHHANRIYMLYERSPHNHFECKYRKPTDLEVALSGGLAKRIWDNQCTSLSSKWYISNPVTGELAYEGSGSDFDTWLYYCYGLARVGNLITGKDFIFEPANKTLQQELFFGILDDGTTFPSYDLFLSQIGDFFENPGSVNIPGGLPSAAADFLSEATLDPYKVKTLATVGGIGGSDTFWHLRNDERFYYKHFPLMFAAMHGTPSNYTGSAAFNEDKLNYEQFLTKAPCQGPRSYRLFAGDDYNFEWSTPSRLVWPENRGQDANSTVQYNGLDYMLLHNLYCLVYGQDFRRLTEIEDINFSSGSYLQTAVDIIGKNVISPSTNVTYTAQNSIRLIPGFQAQAGSIFKANLVSSTVSYAGYSQLNTCTNIPLPSGSRTETSEAQAKSIMMNSPVSNNVSKKLSTTTEEHETKLITYPNPATEGFLVMLSPTPEGLDNAEITVTELTGATVRRQSFTNSIADVIDMRGMPRGIYIVRISGGNKSYNGKVFVK